MHKQNLFTKIRCQRIMLNKSRTIFLNKKPTLTKGPNSIFCKSSTTTEQYNGTLPEREGSHFQTYSDTT